MKFEQQNLKNGLIFDITSSKWPHFVCLFVFVDVFFRRKLGIPIGILPTSRAGVDGNAPYQAQELQITTLANPGIQTNFLPLGRFNPNTT